MNKPLRQALLFSPILSLAFALSGCATSEPAGSAANQADDVAIYAGKPLASWRIAVADFEAEQVLTGDSAVVPKPANPKVPASVVSAKVSAKDGAADALTLEWKDAWYANLRVEGGKPLDMRPYLPRGVLAFDLNVHDLDKGGLTFKIGCGDKCERKIPYLVPARALRGKGWQHLVFSMRCFARDGDDFSAVTQPFALDGSGSGKVSVANVKLRKSGTPNVQCPDYKTVSVIPDMLDESWSIDWWLPRHKEKLEEIKNRRAANVRSEIVFIGDSITHGWEKEGLNAWNSNYKKYNGLALGFGGDRTENVLWRLQHGEVDGIDPKVAVLMFGTNNTGHRQEDPATTTAGIERNIVELRRRLPNTKILLLAIFPRDEKRDGPLRQINEKINAMLPKLADNKHVYFLNINQAFLDADGTLSKDIMPDLLHPNEQGYAIWVKAMEPTLQKLMQ